MTRQSRLSFFTTALAISALAAAAQPASAQQAGTSLRQSVTNNALTGSTDSRFLVAGMASSAEAQQSSSGNRRHEGLGIGAEFGPIFSSFSEAGEDFGNNTGFEGGIFFGGNRPGTVGVMGKLLYAKKGDEFVDLHYLEIPILLRVNVGSNSLSGVSVYGIAGPVFDILLKGKQGNFDVKSNYESLDLGIQFGGGVEITRFLVEGVYTKGIKNVLKGSGGGTTDIKSKSFAVLFGVRFN